MRAALATVGLAAAVVLGGCSAGASGPASAGADGSQSSPSAPSVARDSPSPDGASTARTDPSTAASPGDASGTRSPTTEPASGPDGKIPPKCSITNKQVDLLARDWNRVIGSIDRPDHAKYVESLATRVDRLTKEANTCPGGKQLTRFATITQRISSEVSHDGEAPLSRYDNAITVGDQWLHKLGFQNLDLAVG